MTIKVLLVGLGKVGLEYDLKNKYNLTHFNSFYRNKKFEIVGVCDTNLKKKKFFEEKKINFFSNYKVALKTINANVVVVSTPTATHFKILKNVLKYKSVKLILCEKPFCINVAQARKIKLLDRFNKIYVNYMRSLDDIFYNNVIKKIKNSRILFIEVFYKGSVLNNASHYIQLLNKYFGKCKRVENTIKFDSNFSDFKLIFKRNIQAHFLSSSARGLFLDSMRFFTPKLIINYDNGGHLIYNSMNINNPIYLTPNYFKQTNIIKNKFYENSQKNIVANVYKCILKKNNFLCKSSEAIKIHEIIKKIKNEK
jgi:predicted dehydrogenase